MFVVLVWVVGLIIVSGVTYAAVRRLGAPSPSARADALLVANAKAFAEAGPGDDVLVEGRVQASDAGSFEGPVSGAAVVLVTLTVEDDRGGESFSPEFSVSEALPFIVMSEGLSVSVATKNPRIIDAVTVSSGPVVGVSPKVRAFLEERGKPTEPQDGFVRRREYRERYVALGSEVAVIGRKVARSTQAVGYRGGPGEGYELAADVLVVGGAASLRQKALHTKSGSLVAAIIFIVVGSVVFPVCAVSTAAILGL